jgi:invasion protein IalB
MKKAKSPLTLASIVALALGVAPAIADEVFQDWALRCPEKPGCFLDQRVFVKGQEQSPVLQAAFQLRGKRPQVIGMLRVPLGVLLPPGLELDIDGAKALRIAYSHCRTEGCIALFELTRDLRRRLERGREARVAFQTVEGKRSELPLSLMGITDGLKALDARPQPASAPPTD